MDAYAVTFFGTACFGSVPSFKVIRPQANAAFVAERLGSGSQPPAARKIV